MSPLIERHLRQLYVNVTHHREECKNEEIMSELRSRLCSMDSPESEQTSLCISVTQIACSQLYSHKMNETFLYKVLYFQ